MSPFSKNNNSLILASKSPRRKQLLEMLGIPFSVHGSSVQEIFTKNESTQQIVQSLASQKAEDVSTHHSDALIIGADTLVVLDETILGKPESPQHAKEILTSLSNRSHKVVTGVALIKTDTDSRITQQKTFYKQTEVFFGHLNSSLINEYVDTGAPLDKAGAYGIQNRWGAVFVKRIEGDFYNAMGLPIHALYYKLKKLAPEILNFNS